MDFEQMQKIWNEQKGETMYAINETALHNSVKKKKYAASRRINHVEISLILINSVCTTVLLFRAFSDTHFWNYLGAGLTLLTVVYILLSRHARKKTENTFDRSMLGELDQAIANTNAIVRFSRLMVLGYIIPLSIFIASKMIFLDAPLERWLTVGGLYFLAFLLVEWERRKMHIPRKENLMRMKRKLEEE